MRHLDLFSGIGGFALACKWAGIETVAFVEIDKFCQKVLRKHWPGVPIVEDINNVIELEGIIADAQGKQLDSQRYTDRIIITAGFPCQPFSVAGNKRGARDDRYLWPQTLAIIKAIRPAWVLLENVAGILDMVFPDSKAHMASQAPLLANQDDGAGGYTVANYDTIAGGINRDLEKAGYETGWLIVPACAVGAPHRRDRVWIIAYSINGQHRGERGQEGEADCLQGVNRAALCSGRISGTDKGNRGGINADADGSRGQETKRRNGGRNREEPQWREDWYEVAARFCRVDARVSHRVDRLKGLGNSIVPQVAYEIIRNIQEAEGAR